MKLLNLLGLASFVGIAYTVVDHYRTSRKLSELIYDLQDELGEFRSDMQVDEIELRREAGDEAIYRTGYTAGLVEARERVMRGIQI